MSPTLRIRRLVLASLGAMLLSTSALAASFPATGRLRLDLLPDTLLDPVVISGSFTVSVDALPFGHVNTLVLPSPALQTVGRITPVTDPALGPIQGIQATVLLPAGTFAGGGGPGLGGVVALQGIWKACLFAACDALSVPGNLSVPLAVIGGGGTSVYTAGIVDVTVRGAAWTTGTVTSLTFFGFPTTPATRMGFAHGPASFTSSTAAPSGVVSLVTPTAFRTTAPTGVFSGFAYLDIHIVPEPGSLVLLGLGVGMLAAGARRRGRS